jgi:hypothetical protein
LEDIYRFYYDSLKVAENLVRPWKQEVREANEVAVHLLQLAMELYERAIV